MHRLHATRELIPSTVAKDYMKLEILMGTQRSHAAYRLAWRNTSSARIPFLPLHRRDLATIATGSKTILDERRSMVNWKKIEILGDVVIDLQNVLHMPYTLILDNGQSKVLILEAKIVKDDDVSISMTYHHCMKQAYFYLPRSRFFTIVVSR